MGSASCLLFIATAVVDMNAKRVNNQYCQHQVYCRPVSVGIDGQWLHQLLASWSADGCSAVLNTKLLAMMVRFHGLASG